MFGFFESQEKKMRDNAANWLELAGKVWDYRRDRLGAREAEELDARREELRRVLADRADAAKLKLGIESLEGVLSRVGGRCLPEELAGRERGVLARRRDRHPRDPHVLRPAVQDPDELDVADLLRHDGAEPPPGEDAPGPAGQVLRLLAFGAQRHTAVAPADGEVSVPLFIRGDSISVAYTIRPGRTWLVFPAKVREYTFYVGGRPTTVSVPSDLDNMDEIVFDTFFPDHAALVAQIERARRDHETEPMQLRVYEDREDLYEAERVPMGRTVRAGDPVVRFDLLAGDQLFVDRVSFNFVRPTVGQGFVFRTDNIPGIMRRYGAEFLIKRLIGVPGDQIEVRDPAILRNGKPITGSVAFDLNAGQVSPYRGYSNAVDGDPQFSLLFKGETITVPPNSYLAMGDNSHNSFDGRYWGYVPREDVVGRPLFIYYPLTKRFGTAK